MTSSLPSVSCLGRLVCILKNYKNEERIANFLKFKLGQDPIIGGPKQVTDVETQARVAASGTVQKDVSQDGEVSLELTTIKGDKYAVEGIAKKIVTSKSSRRIRLCKNFS